MGFPWRRVLPFLPVKRANPVADLIVLEQPNYGPGLSRRPLDQDFAEFLRAVKLFPVVMACVKKITSAAVGVPWVYTDRLGDPLPDQRRGKLASLYGFGAAKPNPLQGPRSFRSALYQQGVMLGEAYQWLDPNPIRPNEVWVLRSSAMNPRVSERPASMIDAFVYETRTGHMKELPAENVIYTRTNPHPDDPIRGLSPLHELEETLRTLLALVRSNRNFFAGGAKFAGLLLLKKGNTTPDERKSLGKAIDDEFGPDKSNKTLVLEAGEADWKQLTATVKDMEGTALYEAMRREVFNVFQVPPGLFDSKDVNRSNMREQRALLYTDAVMPLVESIAEDINRTPFALGAGESVKPDWEQVEALQPNQLEEAQTLQTLSGKAVMTRNEARSRLGLPPVEGGDEFSPDAPSLAEMLSAQAGGNGNGNGRRQPVPVGADDDEEDEE